MSQENVELVRRTFEHWNAGEREIDPEILDPEVVVHSAMTNATDHGYEGLRRWMVEIDQQFDDWKVLIDEFREASEGRPSAWGLCASVAAPAEWRSTSPWPCSSHCRGNADRV